MDAPLHFEGHLDDLSAAGLMGWAAEGFAPAQVLIEINGERSGSCVGGVYREDLIVLGRSPRSGFFFRFNVPLKVGDIVSVTDIYGRHLVNSPKVFAELSDRAIADHLKVDRECLFFMHIPKTAGTALRSQIQAHTKDVEFVYNRELSDPLFIQTYRSRPLPRLFFGHFSYGVHEMVGARARYACVLRNPVDRIISLYAHQFSSGYRNACRLPFGNAGLQSFLREGYDVQTNNHMCRIVTGVADDQINLRENWLLDYAFHNLRCHFDLAVSCNRLDIVRSYLKNLVETDVGALQKENVSRMPGFDIDPISVEMISELNSLDIILYERIVKSPILARKV